MFRKTKKNPVVTGLVFAVIMGFLTGCSLTARGINSDATTGFQNVYIVTPAEGAILDGLVKIEVDVRNIDISAISKIEFYVNDSLIFYKSIPPYAYTWDASGYPDGPVAIKAVVVDVNGGRAETTVLVNHYRGVYVSVFGSDYNLGTRESPLRTIQNGIQKALEKEFQAVYVSSGVYSPGFGLNASTSGVVLTNSNLKIIGGYNPMDFSVRSGSTELKGNGTLNHLVYIEYASNLVIDGFSLVDGNANAGGIHSQGAGSWIRYSRDITISNCSFITNRASDSGGGLFVIYCTNVAVDALISNNTAVNYAGGVYCQYNENVSFSGSMSRNINTGGGYGGALYLGSCSGVAVDCLFYGNYSGNAGGAIMADGNINCRISGSILSNYSPNWGGGITIYNGTNYIIANCHMTNNSSGNPNSVIYLVDTAGLKEVVISNCVIGGSLKTPTYAIFENGSVSGHSIVDNVFLSDYLGWFIYYDNSGSHLITNVGLNWTNINNTNWTGAARAAGNRVDWTNTAACVAENGNDSHKGMRFSPHRNVQTAVNLANNLKTGNVYAASGVYERGNGLPVSGDGVTIASINNLNLVGGFNSDYSYRTGVSTLDGLRILVHIIYLTNAKNILIDGFRIIRGYASGASYTALGAGGLVIGSSSNVTFTNCTFFSNESVYGGGAFYCEYSIGIVLDALVTNNFSAYGGGVYVYNSAYNTIRGKIYGNTASTYGGGVYLNGATLATIQAEINSNRSVSYGGGIFLEDCVSNTVSCNIINNYTGASGSAVYHEYGTKTRFVNCAITNNYSAGANPAALFLNNPSSVDLELSGCLIGSANVLGYAIYEANGELSGHRIDNNLFLTNQMTYLYRDYYGTNITVSTTGSGANLEWSQINNRFVTGAISASGNTAQ